MSRTEASKRLGYYYAMTLEHAYYNGLMSKSTIMQKLIDEKGWTKNDAWKFVRYL